MQNVDMKSQVTYQSYKETKPNDQISRGKILRDSSTGLVGNKH